MSCGFKGHTLELLYACEYERGVQPQFCWPYTVPYALKEKVGKELDRQEEAGVLRKVNHADWAVPIVPVVKKDGSLRICGDSKAAIYQSGPPH